MWMARWRRCHVLMRRNTSDRGTRWYRIILCKINEKFWLPYHRNQTKNQGKYHKISMNSIPWMIWINCCPKQMLYYLYFQILKQHEISSIKDRFWKKWRNTSILLNAGRGSAVNTEDLCEALIQGQIYGAGLDVTDPEPLQTQHKLWNVENVIITPHVAGDFHHPATLYRIVDIIAGNLQRYLEGEQLMNIVDTTTGCKFWFVGSVACMNQKEDKKKIFYKHKGWHSAFLKAFFYKSLIRACSFDNSLAASQKCPQLRSNNRSQAHVDCKKTHSKSAHVVTLYSYKYFFSCSFWLIQRNAIQITTQCVC